MTRTRSRSATAFVKSPIAQTCFFLTDQINPSYQKCISDVVVIRLIDQAPEAKYPDHKPNSRQNETTQNTAITPPPEYRLTRNNCARFLCSANETIAKYCKA